MPTEKTPRPASTEREVADALPATGLPPEPATPATPAGHNPGQSDEHDAAHAEQARKRLADDPPASF